MSILPTEKTRVSIRWHLLIITGVALLARAAAFVLIYGVKHLPLDQVGGGDGSAYIAMTHSVYALGTLADSLFLPRPFLFSALTGVASHLTGENTTLIVFANLLLNVLTCLILYPLAEAVSGSRRVALYTGLLAAVYPAMLLAAISYMTESLFLFFYVLALLLFVRFLRSPNGRDLVLSALILACATLTRSITLLLPFLLIGLIVIGRSRQWKRYLVAMAVIGLLPIAILVFRNWYYGGIATVSTESQWILLFMRATASERRATGAAPDLIYAQDIQEIERRLGHPVPPLTRITPDAIWNYFQPTPAMQSVISQLAVEKNLAYPQWYVINSFYGLFRVLLITDEALIPPSLSIVLHGAFVLLSAVGFTQLWRSNRHAALLFGLCIISALGITVALETSVLNTRHGLPAALPMFVLAGQGILWVEVRLSEVRKGNRLAATS